LVGAADLTADLLLCNVVEVADVLVVTNVDAVSSSTARVLSESLGDLEREAAAVACVVRMERNLCFSSEGVPRVAPSLLPVGLGVWELGGLHDHEGVVLTVWSAEDMLRKLLAFFGKGHDLDVVIAAILAPVDVHISEVKSEGSDASIVGEDLPVQIFVVTVVLNDNLVTRSDVLVFGIE